MKWNLFNSSIGIALGGGAARGIAHIGVLKAFEESDIKISFISGTSIGALVACYYAFGKDINAMKAIGEGLNYKSILSLSIHKKGIFTTKSIRNMILKDIGDVNIEDALIPLAICATDISNGEQVVLRQGNLANAVCASTAIPGIFSPVEIDGRVLVDGGITENVPISLLDQMGSGITIAVDLNGNKKYREPEGMISIMSNAIDIAIDLRTIDQLKKADFIISLDLENYNRMDNTEQFEELYNEGYQTASKKIKQILWYKKIRLLFYLKKLYLVIAPLKIPNLLTWWRS